MKQTIERAKELSERRKSPWYESKKAYRNYYAMSERFIEPAESFRDLIKLPQGDKYMNKLLAARDFEINEGVSLRRQKLQQLIERIA